MVLMDALANALKSINNAEKRGKRQVKLPILKLPMQWWYFVVKGWNENLRSFFNASVLELKGNVTYSNFLS